MTVSAAEGNWNGRAAELAWHHERSWHLHTIVLALFCRADIMSKASKASVSKYLLFRSTWRELLMLLVALTSNEGTP